MSGHWPARRRLQLILRVLSRQLTVGEAAAGHGLTVAQIEEWRRRFLHGGEHALAVDLRPDARWDAPARLLSIIDNTTAVIYVKDVQGRYLMVNRQYERLFHVTRETILGRTDHDVFVPAAAEAFRANDQQVLEAGGPMEFEERVPQDDGLHIYISIKFPLLDAAGRPDAVCGISTDITERKRAEERLRQLSAELEAFYHAQPDLTFKVALDGTILDYKTGRMSGLYLPPEQFVGRRAQEVLPPEVGVLIEQAIVRACAPAADLVTVECALSMGDGRTHHYEARLTPLAGERILVLIRDISQRRHAEESLHLLAQHLVTVREEERARLGFDLHDGVCQELAGVGILVAAARAHLGSAAPEVAAKLERAEGYLGKVIDHLRLLAHDLRPMLLHELGLAESLRSLALSLSTPQHRVVTTFARRMPQLDETADLAIYRVAQEALTNAARHAHARLTTLTLGPDGGMLRLVVQDDGCGFDTRDARTANLGIASMEERALAVGGRLELVSEPGRGTRVTFECPLGARRPREQAG